MPQQHLQFHAQIAAPIDAVFAFLADHQNFASLFGGHCTRIRAGDDPSEPDGYGSTRRIGPGLLSFDETIVTFERPRRLEYTISRGGPLKNHRGSIQLRSSGGNTQLDYSIVFDGKLPGAALIAAKLLRLGWSLNGVKRLRTLEG